MANDRKNQNQNQSQNANEQRDGMRKPQHDQGGNQQVSRDRDQQDRNKMGEQEGMERQQSGARNPNQSPDAGKGELGTEIDDEQDELGEEDVALEDENRITQRNDAQRGSRPDSAK